MLRSQANGKRNSQSVSELFFKVLTITNATTFKMVDHTHQQETSQANLRPVLAQGF